MSISGCVGELLKFSAPILKSFPSSFTDTNLSRGSILDVR